MKNIERIELLEDIKEFFVKNNLNITSCGCCGGYHIEKEGEDLCEGCDFREDIEDSIKFYKEHTNKIFVNYFTNYVTSIEFIKDDNKIVNLGGRSHPFTKYLQKRYMKFSDIVL